MKDAIIELGTTLRYESKNMKESVERSVKKADSLEN